MTTVSTTKTTFQETKDILSSLLTQCAKLFKQLEANFKHLLWMELTDDNLSIPSSVNNNLKI